MRDRELYRKILGIEAPWEITEVDLMADEGQIHVHLENGERRLPCPVCGASCPRHDTRPRWWRHLDTCQFPTLPVAAVPPVRCDEHGVRQVKVPWAEPGSSFTALFEALVIDWLQEASIAATERLLGLSWKSIDTILRRAVKRGLARREAHLPKRLGVDETSFQKRHEYVTVVVDQDRGTVVHVADGRGREALGGFLEGFSEEERTAVESISMDMWEAYISAVKAHIPAAEEKIVFDKFHVAQHMSQAVDKVRRQEAKTLLASGDERLKGTKYLWLRAPAKLYDSQKAALQALKASSLKTARAWAIKEMASGLWGYRRRGWARKGWMRWYAWAIRSRLEPMKRVARMIKGHLGGIVNAVVLGVTNAMSEGINSKIQRIKFNARGFRNRVRYREAILFHLGGLSLYPEGAT